jgi:hypothetical protein
MYLCGLFAIATTSNGRKAKPMAKRTFQVNFSISGHITLEVEDHQDPRHVAADLAPEDYMHDAKAQKNPVVLHVTDPRLVPNKS